MIANNLTDIFTIILLSIGVFLGITLGLFLLITKSAKNRANKYLGILLLVFLSYYIPPLIIRLGLIEYFPYVSGIMRIAPFLIGPVAYLYTRSCTQKGFEMRPLLWLHLIPFCLDIVYHLPFYMQTAAEKVEYSTNFRKSGDIREHPVWLFLKATHLLVYYVLVIRLIYRYKRYLTNTSSAIDASFHRWLLVFVSVIIVPILGLISFAFTKFQGTGILGVVLILFPFILTIYIAILVKPKLFHAFPNQMPIPSSSENKKKKYENSNLQQRQKEKYIEQLKNYMLTHKPYQEPELTLAQLAEQVNIPAHYLSQVINEKLQVNFLDFINGYRVREAQERLTNPKFSHYTILSVAYEAGFNSKSTFYSAFKKVAGMTPSQYRKEQKKVKVT